MSAAWMRPRWLFNRRVAKVLLWVALVLSAAIAANVAGNWFLGGIVGWEQWLADASGYFLLWHLFLYAATAYGWVWMRRRLLVREPGTQAKHRLIRAEIAGVVAIVALEASLLAQAT
ncbi:MULTISPECIES: hypothetical protein [Pseudomonadota]|uniref:hypothetical protein n=1 Tax=Pseudomonadota TaxID=1224 RepID=UPI0003D62B8A|nr:hypothetical protein [Achromobacter xylosoxidans]HBO0525150.1 hypothetical protein [Pseudomonas aeruginosa]HBY2266939.1 hypothetical protein [Klebsiella pneumoniae]AHC45636.1 hypothetical protein AX27061_1171 [Achromobacter xylosoxidans NBRC 15126 = ATCC 27061]QKQ55907.1 hypothetical protein FOC83_24450 [Achromobacter xylosoxidans]QPR94935.1 hypothetical protein I6G72_30965 [Achromobacter xylosoxidans]